MSSSLRARFKLMKNSALSKAGFSDGDVRKGPEPRRRSIAWSDPQFPEIPSELDRNQAFYRQVYGDNLRYDVEEDPAIRQQQEIPTLDGLTSNAIPSKATSLTDAHLSSIYMSQPISSEHIRLITVSPAQDIDDPLDCWLTYHQRNDSPRYDAVSYTWGDIFQTRGVIVNGKEAQVPQSCVESIRAMRDTTKPRTLWIDALCINQQDLQERASQVAQMGDVFRLAQHTFAYLGSSAIEYGTHSSNRDWQDLFKRTWFGRTWVIQEVLLSRNVTFLLGPQRMTLLEVLELCSSLELRIPRLLSFRRDFVHEYGLRPPKHWSDEEAESSDDDVIAALDHEPKRYRPDLKQSTAESSGLPQELKNVRLQNRSVESDLEPVSETAKTSGALNLNYWRLPELLSDTQDFGCLDPRDKLFAILPLFAHPIPDLLYPTYKRTTFEVYKDLSWFFLQQDLPNALSNANGLGTRGLPSWATDWTKPRLQNSALIEPESEAWRAGFPVNKRETRAVRKVDQLVVRGFKVGILERWVRSRGYRFFKDDIQISTLNVQMKHDSTATLIWTLTSPPDHRLDSTIGVIAECLDQLHRTLWQRSLVKEQSNPVQLDQESSSQLRSRRQLTFKAGKNGWKAVIEYLDSWRAGLELDIAFSTFKIQKTDGYSFGYVEYHEFPDLQLSKDRVNTGFCDPLRQWEIGDEICVLLGYNTPFLLRPAGGRYRMIGQCRVLDNSVMSGEYADQLDWSQVWSEPCPAPLQDYIIE